MYDNVDANNRSLINQKKTMKTNNYSIRQIKANARYTNITPTAQEILIQPVCLITSVNLSMVSMATIPVRGGETEMSKIGHGK